MNRRTAARRCASNRATGGVFKAPTVDGYVTPEVRGHAGTPHSVNC